MKVLKTPHKSKHIFCWATSQKCKLDQTDLFVTQKVLSFFFYQEALCIIRRGYLPTYFSLYFYFLYFHANFILKSVLVWFYKDASLNKPPDYNSFKFLFPLQITSSEDALETSEGTLDKLILPVTSSETDSSYSINQSINFLGRTPLIVEVSVSAALSGDDEVSLP